MTSIAELSTQLSPATLLYLTLELELLEPMRNGHRWKGARQPLALHYKRSLVYSPEGALCEVYRVASDDKSARWIVQPDKPVAFSCGSQTSEIAIPILVMEWCGLRGSVSPFLIYGRHEALDFDDAASMVAQWRIGRVIAGELANLISSELHITMYGGE